MKTPTQSKKTLVFIAKAKIKHGDFYDYSLVDYIKNNEKIKIICSLHGMFSQVPGSHLNGSGCPQCGIAKRSKLRKSTLSKFIKKAEKKHDNRYDYSLVDYIKSNEKIKIMCPPHGIFSQAPSSHLSGSGCPQCGLARRSKLRKSTLSEFIKTAEKKHDKRYDYSLVEYNTSYEKVKIICSEHGIFLQKANTHLNGSGCPKCGSAQMANYRRNTLSDFIKKAQSKHGDRYDYSETIYENTMIKTTIVCRIHGNFMQTPHSHMNGRGCPECGKLARVETAALSHFKKVQGNS